MKNRSLLAGLMVCFLFSFTHAQDKLNIKFGKIKPEDFDLSAHTFDTAAEAVVLADIGSSYFDVDSRGNFAINLTVHRRVKILKKSAFSVADVEVPYYVSNGAEERITELKAITYNLEGGKVVETKLESKGIFKDKLDKNRMVKKFTFPALKEGSIIEFTYTINSDFYLHLRGWSFQGAYPVLWSEYNIKIPEYYDYVFLGQGSQNYAVNTGDFKNETFNLFLGGNVSSANVNMISHRWVMKDVPALKEERYTSTLNNYVAKVEFQLNRIVYPMETPHEIMGTWATMRKTLMEDDDFGAGLDKNNNWLDDDIKTIVKDAKTDLDKTKKIYAYVRDNFKCTDYTALYMDAPVKTVYKNRNGNVAELNLLLVTMLKHEKIKATPLILSTRSHGFANELYPIANRFNYVIAHVEIDGNIFNLDASNPRLGFNHLSPKCYNGHARLLNESMDPVYFFPDSLRERKVTLVTVSADDKGALHGTYASTLGYLESLELRDDIKEKGEGDYFKAIQTAYTGDIDITDKGLDSLKLVEEPVTVHYAFNISKGGEDIIYFDPMLNEGLKKNYFASAERFYPVEMPYAQSETFVLNLEVPKGYDVEEMPKSARVSLNDGEGTFDYLVGRNENNIQLKSIIKLNKATFAPEDYNSLRDFFAQVVKKQSEQIVFKKKK